MRDGSWCTDHRQETKAEAPASRKALAKPPTVVSSSPAWPTWQALSTTTGPIPFSPAGLAFSLTVVAPKYCGSTVPPRLRPCSSSFASRILPELAAPWPEKCSRSNPPERSNVRTPVGVAVTGLAPNRSSRNCRS